MLFSLEQLHTHISQQREIRGNQFIFWRWQVDLVVYQQLFKTQKNKQSQFHRIGMNFTVMDARRCFFISVWTLHTHVSQQCYITVSIILVVLYINLHHVMSLSITAYPFPWVCGVLLLEPIPALSQGEGLTEPGFERSLVNLLYPLSYMPDLKETKITGWMRFIPQNWGYTNWSVKKFPWPQSFCWLNTWVAVVLILAEWTC